MLIKAPLSFAEGMAVMRADAEIKRESTANIRTVFNKTTSQNGVIPRLV
jgi:hypothetical protein